MFVVMVVTIAMNDNCLKIQRVQGFARYSVNSLNYTEYFFSYNPDLLICTKVTWSLFILSGFFSVETFYKKHIRFHDL